MGERLPPAVKPRPQLYEICPLGGSLSGKPKKVILTPLLIEHACADFDKIAAIPKVERVIDFIM